MIYGYLSLLSPPKTGGFERKEEFYMIFSLLPLDPNKGKVIFPSLLLTPLLFSLLLSLAYLFYSSILFSSHLLFYHLLFTSFLPSASTESLKDQKLEKLFFLVNTECNIDEKLEL